MAVRRLEGGAAMPRPGVRGEALLCVLLASLALAGCDRPDAAAPPASPPPMPVRVRTVKLEPACEARRYPAVIRPRIETKVGFRVGGKIAERLVDVGDAVTPGAVLARLDPTSFELEQVANEAQLASTRADAANTRREFERYEKLHAAGWASTQEYDRRRTTLDTTEAKARMAQAELTLTRDNARYTTLAADAAGVVLAVEAEPGQVVAAGETVFRIARADGMEAVADIPEAQAQALKDAILSVEVWSLPGVTISAQLRELSPSADDRTRTYRARFALVDPPQTMRLGMTATLVLSPACREQVARLPLSGLTKNGTEPAVWRLNAAADRVELQTVKVLRYSGGGVLVSEGLNNGDRVVTAGVHKLDPSQVVRIWTEPSR